MDTTTIEALSILLLIVLSAVYSGMESALFSLSEVKLRGRQEDGKLPKTLRMWLDAPNHVLTGILIGNNLVNITASALATDLSNRLFEGSGGAGPLSVAIGVMTLLILIVGEVVPKTFAKHHPEKYLVFLPVVRFTLFVFYLPTRALVYITHHVVGWFGGGLDSELRVTEEDIENMVRIGKQDGSIDPEQTRLLTGVLEMDEKIARDIMVPRTNMVAFSSTATVDEIVASMSEVGHSRYPVYDETPDHVVGVLYVKDLLAAVAEKGSKNVAIKPLLRKALLRPDSLNIQQLLVDMKADRVHMAVLVSEYGGIEGLVTLEDIVEEVFGPIYDEHDGAEAIRELKSQSWHLDGGVSLGDLKKDLDIVLEEDEDYNTVAGLLMKAASKVPTPGFVHQQEGWRFEVLRSDETRVLEVALRPTALARRLSEAEDDSKDARNSTRRGGDAEDGSGPASKSGHDVAGH